ncbi:hypothetical protein BDR04DRAFT_1120822 [Suillus decipiens]|nr:hypothetical protein BDR04DRAFT_1120822 [Suillus decipiens]
MSFFLLNRTTKGQYIKLGDAPPKLSLEIRASFEFDRTLGKGEVIGKLEPSWDAPLAYGNIAFPPVCGARPCLTLKATVLHPCDNQDSALLESIAEYEIARETDAGHERFATYVTSGNMVSYLNDAIQHFPWHLPSWHRRRGKWHRLYDPLMQQSQCGSTDDLDECIQYCREAVSLCSEGDLERDDYLNNLALSFWCRFNHQGNYYVNNAISLYEEALHRRPVGHKHPNALSTRFRQHRDVNDISRAISLHREAPTLCPPGSPYRDNTVNNLSFALKDKYEKSGVSEDLNEAIDLFRDSLQSMQYGHSFYCSSRVQCKSVDLSLAVDNFRLASQHPTQGFPDRIWKAWNWIMTAQQFGHSSALEAYATFFDLLDRHLATRSSVISRREATAAFQRTRSAPVNAASCAIWRDNVRHAIELLEQGRGQQWTPLEDLVSMNPGLAHKFSGLSKRLADAQGSTGNADRAAVQYRRLQEQWEAVVADIRNLKGFSRFLLPTSCEDFQAAARHGPVIIFIVSQYSCSAIIVPTSGELHNIPLPPITVTELKNLKDRFTRAIREASWMSPAESRTDLIVLSRIIWDEIMLPIISGQPRAGKSKELLAVDCEVQLVRKLVPATVNRATISGDAATRAGALQALEENNWMHLACHGKQDRDQPYNSHFVMKDEPITLLDIMEKDTPHAEFAFLSACHTAVGDKKTPDEVIHLAAGLQFSGFKSVIGTLWEVNDDRAVHAVKTKVPLEQGMVFIHVGV